MSGLAYLQQKVGLLLLLYMPFELDVTTLTERSFCKNRKQGQNTNESWSALQLLARFNPAVITVVLDF